MKAVDPTIRVGIEVFGADFAGFGQWDQTVLGIAGPAVDFVDTHVYAFPLNQPDAQLLTVPRQFPDRLGALRAMLDENSGAPGHHVDVFVGETNSATEPTAQQSSIVNALYLADDLPTMLESGASRVAWFALHSGGFRFYGGDLGLLSTGDCDSTGKVCAPPADTPFPAYFGMQLVGRMVRTGGRLVSTASADPLVRGHAVREPDGTLAVLLLNDDPAAVHPVRLDIDGYRVGDGVRVLSFGQGDSGVRSGWEAGVPQRVRKLAPYSLTLLLLRPA
jgi:hypothetical protein